MDPTMQPFNSNFAPSASSSMQVQFFPGQRVWYKSSTGEERKARVVKVGVNDIDLNIRAEADLVNVRVRDDQTEVSSDDEYEFEDEEGDSDDEDYDPNATYSVGQTVWYTSSSGEELKARVMASESGGTVDLNIREEADLQRVRPRDGEVEQSDEDEYDHLEDDDDDDDDEMGGETMAMDQD